MRKIIISLLLIVCLLATSTISIIAFGSENTNEIANTAVSNPVTFNGYILYTSFNSGTTTYLINSNKQVVHKWNSNHFGMDAHLLEIGNLLRTRFFFNIPFVFLGGCTGGVEMFDWNGSLLWKFRLSNFKNCLHHEIKPLPNGDILMIAWEKKTRNEAIAAGRSPDLIKYNVMWSDYIIEVKPIFPEGATIVWEWHAWDHLIQDYDSSKANYGVVADHPELIDINSGSHYERDWLHTNSIDYNEEFGQILLSSGNMNEIFIIDHSTTTKEAAGHTGGKYGKGGDLLYRWGNPQNYRAGNKSDQQFFFQHDARWIEPGCPGAGHITVFNTRNKPSSSVDEIVPPEDSNGDYYLERDHAYGPEKPVWSYHVSIGWSGAQRLPNGDTLITIANAPKHCFYAVTPEKNVVWYYRYSLFSRVWKMEYYPPDYPGLNQ